MDKVDIIQWHPGFVAAMKLELLENNDDLQYLPEMELNTEPIRADLLVIEKADGVKIKNEIGHIFHKYNLFEYKSPDDSLNIDVFYKGIAYACLYKSYGKTINEIKAEDVTITFVRESKPERMFQELRKSGYVISEAGNGIYKIFGNIPFACQVLVTESLDDETHIWIKSLSRNVTQEHLKCFILEAVSIKNSKVKELADAVSEVVIKANRYALEELKRKEPKMCEALKELMKPEIEEELSNAVKETEQKTTLANLRSIISRFHTPLEDAMNILNIPDKQRDYYRKNIL